MPATISPLMTVADLEAMPEDGNRYEVIEGELFVSRAPGLTHQVVSGNVYVSLRSFLELNPIGMVVHATGVIFSEIDGVVPDIVFFFNETRDRIVTGDRLTGAPDLVIEILSPGASNVSRDRVAKLQLYGRHGVLEYWIVDYESRQVEQYKLEDGGFKLRRVYSAGERIQSELLPGYECDVAEFFRN